MILDLFAGPGGWDEGARLLGLAPVGLEWEGAACRTAVAAGHARVRCDVAAPPLHLPGLAGRVQGLIASPPCQTFSKAGKQAGRDALPELQDAVERVWRGASPLEVCPPDLDPRSVLVLEPVRYARDLRPEWIALEQVPAVQPIWRALQVWLREAGYSCWVGTVNAADYGVPQTRTRTLLLASRVRQVQPPPPTHSKEGCEGDLFGGSLERWQSMAGALGWHPATTVRDTFGAPKEDYPGRLDSREKPATGPAPTLTSHAGDWRVSPPTAEQLEVWGDRPATTVVGSFAPDVIAAPGYRLEVSRQNAAGSVKVSVQEAGVLQSFPADYPWWGSKSKQHEQVGNACPPRLSAHVLAAVTGLPAPTYEDSR